MVDSNLENDDEVVEVDNPGKDNTVWSLENEEKLILLMEEEVLKGNKSTTTFDKAAWHRIRVTLSAQTKKKWTDVQLRNKWSLLKKKQSNFKKLLGQTGIGYSAETGMVTASEDIWLGLERVYRFAKKFKKKGCPFYEKLCIICGDSTATCANAHPSTLSPSDSEDEGNNDPNSEVNLENTEEHSDSPNQDKSSNPSSSRRGKRHNYSSALTSALESYNVTFKRKIDLLEKSIAKSPSLESSSGAPYNLLKESMDALNELEDIDGESYAKAVGKFHDDELWRALFLEMPQELFNYRHSSLRNVIERCFGVLKVRFPILKQMPSYSLRTQRYIIIACCAVHNFIRMNSTTDHIFDEHVCNAVEVGRANLPGDDTVEIDVTPGQLRHMARVRDEISQELWAANQL